MFSVEYFAVEGAPRSFDTTSCAGSICIIDRIDICLSLVSQSPFNLFNFHGVSSRNVTMRAGDGNYMSETAKRSQQITYSCE